MTGGAFGPRLFFAKQGFSKTPIRAVSHRESAY